MFTVVERSPYLYSEPWLVQDDRGEERGRFRLLEAAVRFALHLTVQAQDAALSLDNTAGAREVSFVKESYRRGQAAAYEHAAIRLSFLLGGTLPRGGKAFRQQLDELKDKLDLWAVSSKEQADQIKAKLDPPLDTRDF